MTSTRTALDADWLGACRRAVAGLQRLFAESSSTAQRVIETGTRGSGGDRTLVLDSSAESIVVAELQTIHAQGHAFHALSEERGEMDFGGTAVHVIIDPIDGSTNAKRDALHYSLSVAVADGETMADVAFGFVHDFGCDEEWAAVRHQGAWCNGVRLNPQLGERRARDGKLELVGIESADPRWVRDAIDELTETAHRLRALGTIAVTLCQVAAARYDGMVTLRRCRGVDAAAGQLIVREAGGLVSFSDCADPLGAPLDATPSSHLVAARTIASLHELERVAS